MGKEGVPQGARPNFNFNVSHEGDYVILATENVCIVGVSCGLPVIMGEQRLEGVFSWCKESGG